MVTHEAILREVRAMRAELSHLLEEREAEALDQKLEEVLAMVEGGEAEVEALLVAVRHYPAARGWLEERLGTESKRSLSGYSPLPGRRQPLPAPHFACPKKDCKHRAHRHSVLDPVPVCPKHSVPMRRI